MKKHLLIIALLCLSACKTRQVTIAKTTFTDRSVTTQLLKGSTQRIDTTQTVTRLSNQKLTHDSVEIVITPDTGTIQIVNGNYIGKARNISIKHRSLSLQTTNNLMQQNKGEITRSTLVDSIIQKNNIQAQVQNKQITTKGIGSWWLLLIALLLLTCLIVGRIKHFF